MPIKQAINPRKRRIQGNAGKRKAKISIFYRLRARQRQEGIVISLKGKARLLMVKRRRTLLGRKRKSW